jgi:hypothetical protein
MGIRLGNVFQCQQVLYPKHEEEERKSSANSLTDDLTEFGRSFMWHKNSIGPSTVPCGIPESTVASSEYSPSRHEEEESPLLHIKQPNPGTSTIKPLPRTTNSRRPQMEGTYKQLL